MELIDLAQQMKVHKWRMRFAFLPVKRIKMVKGYIEHDGYSFGDSKMATTHCTTSTALMRCLHKRTKRKMIAWAICSRDGRAQGFRNGICCVKCGKEVAV